MKIRLLRIEIHWFRLFFAVGLFVLLRGLSFWPSMFPARASLLHPFLNPSLRYLLAEVFVSIIHFHLAFFFGSRLTHPFLEPSFHAILQHLYHACMSHNHYSLPKAKLIISVSVAALAPLHVTFDPELPRKERVLSLGFFCFSKILSYSLRHPVSEIFTR